MIIYSSAVYSQEPSRSICPWIFALRRLESSFIVLQSTNLLKLQREALGAALPNSYYEAKKLIKDLGLDYIKIDACQNDCILYWKENENLNECPTCGLSRWKTVDTVSSKGVKVPCKVLRHFPLKARLQRLYMSRKTAKDMQWHKLERVDGKIMRHPADSDAWKSFDKDYGEFSTEENNKGSKESLLKNNKRKYKNKNTGSRSWRTANENNKKS